MSRHDQGGRTIDGGHRIAGERSAGQTTAGQRVRRAGRDGGPQAVTEPPLDLVIKNVRVVRPRQPAVDLARPRHAGRPLRADRARHSRPATPARSSTGAASSASPASWTPTRTRASTPRCPSDAQSESKAAAAGGVTAMLTYFRTGQYYLNRGGPYARLLPRGAPPLGRPLLGRLRVPPRPDPAPPTSARWRRWRSSTGCRRSRSSCSTGTTASTGRPTAATSGAS